MFDSYLEYDLNIIDFLFFSDYIKIEINTVLF